MTNILYWASLHAQYAQMMGAFWLTFWVGIACCVLGATISGIIVWWVMRRKRDALGRYA